MADYEKQYYTDRAWKVKGKELLDAVQDVDAELRIANRNTKFLISALPFSASVLVLPVIYTFFIFNAIVILVMVVGIAVLGANLIVLFENLNSTGKISYNKSLPHRLEQARRKYHEWLEADAEPRPPKPEPKLVSQEVVPAKQGKVISRKMDYRELETYPDEVVMLDGKGSILHRRKY